MYLFIAELATGIGKNDIFTQSRQFVDKGNRKTRSEISAKGSSNYTGALEKIGSH